MLGCAQWQVNVDVLDEFSLRTQSRLKCGVDQTDQLPSDRLNWPSLTTPALSRVFLGFFFCLSLNSRTLRRRRTNCVLFCCFGSSVSP